MNLFQSKGMFYPPLEPRFGGVSSSAQHAIPENSLSALLTRLAAARILGVTFGDLLDMTPVELTIHAQGTSNSSCP